jgi:WD40 repeat protein
LDSSFEQRIDLYASFAPDYLDHFILGVPGSQQRFATSDDGLRPLPVPPVLNINGRTGDDSPDGALTSLGSKDGTYVFDLLSSQLVVTLPLPLGSPAADAIVGNRFHPIEPLLLVSASSGLSELWNSKTWTKVETPNLSSLDITAGYWNADGSLLATTSSVGTVSIRDGSTFELIRNMVGSSGNENLWAEGGLLFSADSKHLLTNIDGPGRLWNVTTGEQIGSEFETHRSTNSGANYGENLQLVTGTEKHALIWNLDIEEWPEIACKTAGSNLTENEWQQWGPSDEPYRAICPQFPLPE